LCNYAANVTIFYIIENITTDTSFILIDKYVILNAVEEYLDLFVEFLNEFILTLKKIIR